MRKKVQERRNKKGKERRNEKGVRDLTPRSDEHEAFSQNFSI